MVPVYEQQYSPDSFPELALMASLIDLYFTYINIYMPVLHRPTFEQGIREGLHLRDEGFGSTVLLVCAVGSKFSDDPRVFVDPAYPQSGGWKYFSQVQAIRKAIKLTPPTLYDVQIPCVSTGKLSTYRNLRICCCIAYRITPFWHTQPTSCFCCYWVRYQDSA